VPEPTWLIVADDPLALGVARSFVVELAARGHRARCGAVSTAGELSVRLHVDRPPEAARHGSHPQGYRLAVAAEGVEITAPTAAGLFYGTRTLLQLVGRDRSADAPLRIAGCVIDDAPSFDERGFMLDVSRDKVPTLATLFAFVELLAGYKVNQLQLYMEHTFAYRGHDSVWAHASPFTAADIQALDAHCRAHFIELVPNQNSFGHMQRWLKLPEYRHLAECPSGFAHPWNPSGEPYGLCPSDPGSLALLAGLYDQLLPNFTSRSCNVGLDETIDLGLGRSREACEREGTGRVYLKFLRSVHRLLAERGHTMQFWADIVLRQPEIVGDLPRDAVALAWGYEADHPFAEQAEVFSRAGLDFYVCPGTSSWNSLAGRTANALANLRSAARAGVDCHARGYLVTDWGDNGHLQPLPVSYLGMAAGAGLAWNAEASDDLEAATVQSLDDHVFGDTARVMGGVVRDLGNAYLHAGATPPNASALFHLLVHPARELPSGVSQQSLLRVCEFVAEAARPLSRASPRAGDADLLLAELAWVRDALLCAARLGLARGFGAGTVRDVALCAEVREVAERHRANWLLRNRPGGLADSEMRLTAAISSECGASASGDPARQLR
jgi:hexosaminidase